MKTPSTKGASKALNAQFTSGKSVKVPIGEARNISSKPKPFKSTRGKGMPRGC